MKQTQQILLLFRCKQDNKMQNRTGYIVNVFDTTTYCIHSNYMGIFTITSGAGFLYIKGIINCVHGINLAMFVSSY